MYLHFLNYIWPTFDTFVILAAFVFPFYYYFFLVKKRKPLFGNPIAMKYEVIVIVYQLTLENGFSANFTVAIW